MNGVWFLSRGPTGWCGLLVMVLGVAVQACGGSGGSSAPKSDASPSLKDAAKDSAPDASIPSLRDGASDVDSGSADAAQADAAKDFEVGALDVPNQDAGVVVVGDAEDVSPSNLLDMADNAGIGAWDNASEASPAMETRDAVATDMDDELSSANFSCSTWDSRDSGAVQQRCYDFSDSRSAEDFTPEAGTWTVSEGVYNASGPSAQVICPGGVDGGSGMIASLLEGLSAQDVRIHAKLTSVVAPDKVLVLRSRPGGNRIELNFVANYSFDGEDRVGALNISELVSCVNTTYLDANIGNNKVQIPHAIGQAIVVDVQLVGAHLTVVVDGKQVFDDTLPVSTAGGSVGFAVFREAETQFDDLLVEVLR